MTDGMPSKIEMISGKKEDIKNQLEVSLGAKKFWSKLPGPNKGQGKRSLSRKRNNRRDVQFQVEEIISIQIKNNADVTENKQQSEAATQQSEETNGTGSKTKCRQ